MKMKRKLKDERVEYIKNVIGRRGFLLLCFGISCDLMIKLAYWRPGMETVLGFFLSAGLELIMLLLSLLYVIAAAARRGILLAVDNQETPTFPKKLYFFFACWIGFFVLGSFLIRSMFYPHWEAGTAAFILIIGGLMFFTFLICYGVCLTVFQIAFKTARKAVAAAMQEDQEVSEVSAEKTNGEKLDDTFAETQEKKPESISE